MRQPYVLHYWGIKARGYLPALIAKVGGYAFQEQSTNLYGDSHTLDSQWIGTRRPIGPRLNRDLPLVNCLSWKAPMAFVYVSIIVVMLL